MGQGVNVFYYIIGPNAFIICVWFYEEGEKKEE